MYLSNQARQKLYARERVAEDVNADRTQSKLYRLLAQQAQGDEQANNLVELAQRVGTQLIDPKEPTNLSRLLTAIADNKLSQFMKAAEQAPSKGLVGVAKVVHSVIRTADFKEATNKQLAELVSAGKAQPQMVANALAREIKSNPLFQKLARDNGVDVALPVEAVATSLVNLHPDVVEEKGVLPMEADEDEDNAKLNTGVKVGDLEFGVKVGAIGALDALRFKFNIPDGTHLSSLREVPEEQLREVTWSTAELQSLSREEQKYLFSVLTEGIETPLKGPRFALKETKYFTALKSFLTITEKLEDVGSILDLSNAELVAMFWDDEELSALNEAEQIHLLTALYSKLRARYRKTLHVKPPFAGLTEGDRFSLMIGFLKHLGNYRGLE